MRTGTDSQALPAWGFYLKNAGHVTLENVNVTCSKPDMRPVLMAVDGVKRVTLKKFNHTRVPGVEEPFAIAPETKMD